MKHNMNAKRMKNVNTILVFRTFLSDTLLLTLVVQFPIRTCKTELYQSKD